MPANDYTLYFPSHGEYPGQFCNTCIFQEVTNPSTCPRAPDQTLLCDGHPIVMLVSKVTGLPVDPEELVQTIKQNS